MAFAGRALGIASGNCTMPMSFSRATAIGSNSLEVAVGHSSPCPQLVGGRNMRFVVGLGSSDCLMQRGRTCYKSRKLHMNLIGPNRHRKLAH
jgi:hypothetical protein